MPSETVQKTVSLGKLLTPERVLLFRGKKDKAEVFSALIDVLAKDIDGVQKEDISWGIFHREGLMSTGIGSNIATPHVRIPSLESSFMAIGVCPDGIADYHAPDSLPVRLVFMIVAGGKDQKTSHLKVLAAVSSLFYDGRLKAAFMAASDPKTCYETILRAES